MRKDYWWLNDESQKILEEGYLVNNQTVDQKLDLITKHAAYIYGDESRASRYKEVFVKGFASLSSPIWANFGQGRALPISCFSSYVPDSLSGIFNSLEEVGLMTKGGGGTAGYFPLRGRGDSITGGSTSSGAVSFISWFDSVVSTVKQNNVRRGAFAGYMEITHSEIEDFLSIKDEHHSIQTMNTAVCVGDDWMKDMISGDSKKRSLWGKLLKSRREKGIPYLFFKDNVNNNKPDVYKDKGLTIHQSNLCNEIFLPTSEEESLVCCLLSMNLETYEDWKDTDAVELMVEFLDCVMQDFIDKASNMKGFERASLFAKRHRALGLGVMGWHSLLQSKFIPFESFEAQQLNTKVFKDIRDKALASSKRLAEEKGEPELLEGYGRRNTTLLAVAPTTSSAAILGQVSPSIEPFKANYFRVGLAKGSYTRKNKYLESILESTGNNTSDTWESIRNAKGSVQHLSFLTDREKEVFKTFAEISPLSIIQQAAARQKFICQGQSLNLMIPSTMSPRDINKIHIEAWELGLKGLYYQRGSSVAKDAVLSMMECKSCEG